MALAIPAPGPVRQGGTRCRRGGPIRNTGAGRVRVAKDAGATAATAPVFVTAAAIVVAHRVLIAGRRCVGAVPRRGCIYRGARVNEAPAVPAEASTRRGTSVSIYLASTGRVLEAIPALAGYAIRCLVAAAEICIPVAAGVVAPRIVRGGRGVVGADMAEADALRLRGAQRQRSEQRHPPGTAHRAKVKSCGLAEDSGVV